MKLNELLQLAQTELDAERLTAGKAIIKQQLVEIAAVKRTVTRMETQLNELLAKDLADVVDS